MTTSTDRPDYAAMQKAIFRGEDPGGVLWQPRIDFWYKVNKQRGTLPDHLKDASLLDVTDYCYASCRYFLWDRSWFTDHAWLKSRQRTVEVTAQWEDDRHLRRTWHTPLGTLSQVIGYDEWKLSSHIVEFRLKQPGDLQVMRYILEDEEWYWDSETFAQDMAIYGAYGVPQFYFRRSPIQRLIIEEMGFEQTIYFMTDHPELLDEYVEFATAADDAMYEVICNSPVAFLNLGENIDGFIVSPPLWRRHLIPYYRKRVEQLHRAGKYVSIHIDGVMKPLLPYLQACPFDAIEAATPLPQGDVTLEEIKAGLGEMILMDGLPALYFLPDQYPVDTLVEATHNVVEMFHPRLVLGVSDEIPPDTDIERVRLVGELVQDLA